MKKKTLEILEKVSKNELTPDEAQKQLFVLFGVINQVCHRENIVKSDCARMGMNCYECYDFH